MTWFIPASGQKQNAPSADGIFAGKTGGDYTVEELSQSDWTIRAADPGYSVTEFKMTIVFKKGTTSFQYYHGFTGYEIIGNIIPMQYRDKILNEAEKVYLEYIKAANERRVTITVKPIEFRIQP